MIRSLRRWLLGAETDGPPLLADPFCRYEARRYWTLARYVWLSVVLIIWLFLIVCWLSSEDYEFGERIDFEMIMPLLVLSVFWRAPLSFMASTGSALCIVPERVSGQFEQFILTPVDSWRFCLARLAGRLRGLAMIWMVTGVLMILAGLLFGGPVLACLAVVLHVDLAAMLLVDAAVGMRFSATCRSVAAAQVKTYLTNFVLTPFSMFLGALAGGGTAVVVVVKILDCRSEPVAMVSFVTLTLLTRLGLGAMAIRLALRDARRAMEKTFYQPGE